MVYSDKKLKSVKKIAVLRANALGDFIFSIPALYALRATYPDAEITYLGCGWHKEFLEKRPSPIDRVIVVPDYPGVRESSDSYFNKQAIDDFFSYIQKESFDIAIQMHGGGKNSNPFILRLNHKLSVGSCTSDAQKLDRWIPYSVYHNEYARYMEIVSLVGAKPIMLDPSINVISEDIEKAKKHAPLDKPYIVIHPGASDPRRRWSARRFAKVADALFLEGYEIVIVGTNFEAEVIDEVLRRMEGNATNLCDKLSLSELTGVLFLSEALIANDSGPLHLADSIGIPTVGLYWCGNGIVSAPLIRSNRRVLLSWVINCPICGENCAGKRPFLSDKHCDHLVSFINAISAAEVLEAFHELLLRRVNSSQEII